MMFAHCDINSFYCSCESAFNPRLLGLPIVVLANNDHIVISRSKEAKALGVKMGALYFENANFFKKKQRSSLLFKLHLVPGHIRQNYVCVIHFFGCYGSILN